MASPPLVLHVSNEHPPVSADYGFLRAFRELSAQGVLRHEWIAPAATPERIAGLAAGGLPDLVFVQSPQPHPWTRRDVAALLRRLGSPPVVVWEGDAWGGRKRLRARNVAWLRHADGVYSVALGRQAELLRRAGGRPVRYVPHVTPLCFAEAPDEAPHEGAAPRGVALVGSRLTFCGIELIPDDGERTRLARELARVPDCGLSIYGRGWRGPHAVGPVPYDDQVAVMRRALITAGWDRFRRHPGYFSDRLPIAMSAGRPHVTSRQPDLGWLPGPETGLHLTDTPREAAERVRDLLGAGPERLLADGARGRAWARAHLTELHALRHMLAHHLPVPAPRSGPWPAIAALGTG
ncbi:hypothetical protein Q5762_23670 [Streptomyces sp. P9(2023)]|uniref:glycosyltransferase family protein n=1 Tax=Streptomyces sp. P9(2023) TaxID=3064394 RepID=UPI0028F41F60|nr:hypothetical protein [Streptomyces sp. P9(2023)]MDT9691291.1 hypothetical protein [Streptomyces sp. P9(2023)]